MDPASTADKPVFQPTTDVPGNAELTILPDASIDGNDILRPRRNYKQPSKFRDYQMAI